MKIENIDETRVITGDGRSLTSEEMAEAFFEEHGSHGLDHARKLAAYYNSVVDHLKVRHIKPGHFPETKKGRSP